MSEKIIIGVVVAGLILVTGILATRDFNITVDPPSVSVGANAGPESTNDYQCYAGLCTHFRSSAINQASTTVCSLKSPGATSTLMLGSVTLTTGTTTATIWEIGKDAGSAGTTTLLGGRFSLGALELGTLYATTTLSGSGKNQAYTFAPNQFFNVKYGGPIGALNVFTGSCKAQFVTQL